MAYYNGKKILSVVSPIPKLIEKTITENGTYNASDDFADGYSEVTVNIQSNFTKLVDGSLTEVTAEMLEGVTSIREYAFNSMSSLISVALPDSVKIIGLQAFRACENLITVNLGGGITTVGNYAFEYCTRLTGAITIPDSVTSIGGYAFSQCSSITSVTIGNGLTSIGSSAFVNCRGLTSIVIQSPTPPTLPNSSVFLNTNDCPIYVPAESVDAYKTATNWSTLASRIQAIPE